MSMQIWRELISKISNRSGFWPRSTAAEGAQLCHSAFRRTSKNKGWAISRRGCIALVPRSKVWGRSPCPFFRHPGGWRCGLGREASSPSPTSLASLNLESKQLSLGNCFILIGKHEQLICFCWILCVCVCVCVFYLFSPHILDFEVCWLHQPGSPTGKTTSYLSST